MSSAARSDMNVNEAPSLIIRRTSFPIAQNQTVTATAKNPGMYIGEFPDIPCLHRAEKA